MLHNIKLSLIDLANHDYKSEWTEEKMQGLISSIKEQGVVLPIKVKGPKPDGRYETIYGNTRLEAAKQAGLDNIDAIVVTVISEEDSLIQAMIENETKGDVPAYEKGKAVNDLKNLGMSMAKQSKQTGISAIVLKRWRDYYLESKSGLKIVSTDTISEKVMQVQELKRSLGDDLKSKQLVLDKAIRENLNEKDTRATADAYKAAKELPNAELLQEQILSMPAKGKSARHILNVAEVDVRAKQRDTSFRSVIEEQDAKEKEATYQEEKYDKLVADYLRMVKELGEAIDAASDGITYDKFDRIAAQFTISRNKDLIEKLYALNEGLENV